MNTTHGRPIMERDGVIPGVKHVTIDGIRLGRIQSHLPAVGDDYWTAHPMLAADTGIRYRSEEHAVSSLIAALATPCRTKVDAAYAKAPKWGIPEIDRALVTAHLILIGSAAA